MKIDVYQRNCIRSLFVFSGAQPTKLLVFKVFLRFLCIRNSKFEIIGLVLFTKTVVIIWLENVGLHISFFGWVWMPNLRCILCSVTQFIRAEWHRTGGIPSVHINRNSTKTVKTNRKSTTFSYRLSNLNPLNYVIIDSIHFSSSPTKLNIERIAQNCLHEIRIENSVNPNETFSNYVFYDSQLMDLLCFHHSFSRNGKKNKQKNICLKWTP